MSSPQPPSQTKALYIMLGGFLGSGKTTAVAALAQRLSAKGLRVGLITNDQGQELVDTAMLRSKGFATEEIPGGCFCCRFNSLVDAADRLTESTRPDVFIAEPVGSCTDLVATVTYPLRRMYGDQFRIAPLSVLLDPVRALRVFGLQPGGSFSPKVLYIYRKQLEEADIIVISKSELLLPGQLEALQSAISQEFPNAKVLAASARTGAHLEEWFSQIETSEQVERQTMDVDYGVYAEGEALLGWLNATAALSIAGEFDANLLIQSLAAEIQQRLQAVAAEIAHLKMTYSPDGGLGDIAVVNLVRNDYVPELAIRLEQPAGGGQLVINLRAEAAPEVLADALRAALPAAAASVEGLQMTLEHLEFFRPGKPVPTHRIEALSE
jgi:Ni2+-binding GTPase involved in maturation of urease and hydrogenase